VKTQTQTLRSLGPRAVLAALALIASLAAASARAAPPTVGDVAPDFRASIYGGGHVRLSDLKGQVVVLNFWATWCGPCRAELPTLDGYARMRKGSGLTVLAIDYNDPDATPAQLRALAHEASLRVVFRFDGDYKPLGGYPTSFVIDRAGVVRYAKAGSLSLDDMNRIFVPLLNEPAPNVAGPTPTSNPR
jgi:cytochrome c biogenesis protein CcmG/thiol:disulfide interchange protein DsbE